MVKTVVFDIGNVVWEFAPLYDQVFTLWATRLDINLLQFRRDLYEANHLYRGFETDHLKLTDWFASLAPHLDPQLFISDMDSVFLNEALFTHYFRPQVIAVIQHLRSQKIPVGCLSNTENFFYPYFEKYITPLFDFQILSWQVGLRKPDLKIYHQVFKFVHALPSEIIFIDDKPQNIAAANQVGFQTILYRNPSDLKRQLIKLGLQIEN